MNHLRNIYVYIAKMLIYFIQQSKKENTFVKGLISRDLSEEKQNKSDLT